MLEHHEYDYVIIGGGTGGLVLANRLSEDPQISVVVVEAGGNSSADPRVATPAFFAAATGSELDWAFVTTPQEHLLGRKIGLAAGKMLGGSSSINAQALIPPSASDLNAWEELGNKGWNWSLAPYLKKPFSLSLPDQATAEHLNTNWAEGFAGVANGPVNASFADTKENPVGKAWVETFNNLGFSLTASPFDGHSIGPYNAASTIDPATKTRSSSNTGYYLPIVERSNLTAILNATVQKILLEQKSSAAEPVATGVEFMQNGQKQTIKATREIILSAGALNSPKTLEISGIGDPAVLAAAGVQVFVENAYVGTNLQDHALTGISFEAKEGIYTSDDLFRKDPAVLQWATNLYQEHKSGPFASSGVTSFAYLPTVDFSEDIAARDSFLAALDSSKPTHPLDSARCNVLRKLLENGDEGTAQYFIFPAQFTSAGKDATATLGSKPQPGNFITLVTAFSHPLSTGTVHITSSDYSVPPTIDNKFFSNPIDLELHARHIRYLETIASTAPLSTLLKPDGRRNHEKSFVNGDLDRARELAGFATTTNWHSCGTCAMAPRDKGGVVDENLRVYGVKGLRVVDASVFPLIPQSNTQALTYAVAERAADLIKESQ